MEIDKRVMIHLILTEKEAHTLKLALECCTDKALSEQNNSRFEDDDLIKTANILINGFNIICLN